jgi:hypothetical protein
VWREWGGLLDLPNFEWLLILQKPAQPSKSTLNTMRQLIPGQRTFKQTTLLDRFRPAVRIARTN